MNYDELLKLGHDITGDKHLSNIKLLINYYKEINKLPNKKTFIKQIKKLKKGIPIQYVIGNVNFCGNLLKVNKNVLIPRFETEELVFYTQKIINENFDNDVSILDIGTGSGAIAITLKKELPSSDVLGIDISSKALKVANINAKENKVNIKFIKGNILKPLKNELFDVIISNPPYINYNEKVEDIVLKNEPHIALFAKNNGLYFYEEILKNIHKHLKEKYLIAFEIGYKEKDDIIKLQEKYLKDALIITKKDLSNKDRFIFIMNKK